MRYANLNSQHGQALVEWALLVWLFLSLFAAIYGFSQWFSIRMQLIQAAKEGARLYSSGRVEIPQVKRLVQRALLRGSPSLRVPLRDIRVGSSGDSQEKFMQLDKVTVRYRPKQIWLKVLSSTMEESCVIKHAPPYGYPGIANIGPPVKWKEIRG